MYARRAIHGPGGLRPEGDASCVAVVYARWAIHGPGGLKPEGDASCVAVVYVRRAIHGRCFHARWAIHGPSGLFCARRILRRSRVRPPGHPRTVLPAARGDAPALTRGDASFPRWRFGLGWGGPGRGCPRPGSRAVGASGGRMPERSGHAVSGGQDARSERPATGLGSPDPRRTSPKVGTQSATRSVTRGSRGRSHSRDARTPG